MSRWNLMVLHLQPGRPAKLLNVFTVDGEDAARALAGDIALHGTADLGPGVAVNLTRIEDDSKEETLQ